MRGIAAVLIAVRHVDDIIWPIRFGASYLALDLFFLLSGTVICHAYEQPLLAGLPLRRFLYARLVRIYPLYLLGTLIGASASLLQPGLHAGDLVSRLGLALLLLPDLASPVLYPLNNPAWSLFFELCANLVYAVLLRYRLRVPPALLVVLSALALAALVIQAPSQALDIGWTRQTVLAGFPRVGFSFFAGVLLYRAFASRQHPHAVPSRAVPSWLPLTVITAALIASPGPGLRPWYDLAVAMLAFPAAVYATLACRPAAWLARACALGGLLSYPVYALHVPLAALLGQAATMLLGRWWLDMAPIPGLLFLAALGPVALLVHHRFDVPVRRALLLRRA